MQSTRSVSYTHLDVYKRQVFGSTLVMLQQIKASNAALQAQHVAHSASKQLTMPRINRPERDVDAEAVNNAIRDIVTPWASLLKALETAAIEAVSYTHLDVYKRQK